MAKHNQYDTLNDETVGFQMARLVTTHMATTCWLVTLHCPFALAHRCAFANAIATNEFDFLKNAGYIGIVGLENTPVMVEIHSFNFVGPQQFAYNFVHGRDFIINGFAQQIKLIDHAQQIVPYFDAIEFGNPPKTQPTAHPLTCITPNY